jgi:HEAT repeat protein
MNNRTFLPFLAAALLTSGFARDGRAADTADPDQARLDAAMLATNNAALVAFLNLRERGEPAHGTLDQLLENLGASTPDARQQACADLVSIGTPVLPRLRALAREGGRSAALARHCVTAIEGDGGTLTIAVARLLANRRASHATRVFLAYLPHAENDRVLQEIVELLRTVAHNESGTADPAVVNALGDEHPLRRATAVALLAEDNLAPHRDAIRKLLLDPAPSVRLRAALVLAKVDDPQAVAALIALLGDVGDGETRSAIEDFLTELAGALGPDLKNGKATLTSGQAREDWLRWWHDTEDPGFLSELKKRTRPEVDLDKVHALVQKLGDNTYEARERAQKDLIDLGMPALPLLRQVFRDPPDLEVRARIRDCIETIEGQDEKAKEEYLPRLLALARLVALRKPPGAAEAILAYLPVQNDDGLREALQIALAAVAYSNGEANPAVLSALTDRSPTRRIAAARALCSVPKPDHLEKVRRLLQDADPAVRLAVAAALAEARDPDALPALASFIAQAPTDLAAQAEDVLSRLAGDAGPKDLPEGDANRGKRSAAWASWAEVGKNNPAIFGNLSTATRGQVGPASGGRLRGYTLLVQPQENMVTALGSDGKQRWALTGLEGPSDAQVLANGHILVAESNRVTERDLSGTVLWKLEGVTPVSVQRLPNGNTFIPCNDVLVEVDRRGKEVLRVMVAGVAAAHRLPTGSIVAFDRSEIIQFDKAGNEVKRSQVMVGGAGCNEVLDNGHVLTLSPGMGNCTEFDQDGNEINRFDQQGVTHAHRLPNGHTLVTIRGTKYVELDKNWQQIKETPLTGDAFRVKMW